jgi:predicted AAA+ superfamily ATPase
MIFMEKVPKKQRITLIERENLWWKEPFGVPNNIKIFQPRPYLDLFLPLVESTSVRRAVVLMGPRRVGKTVLIHHAIDKLLAKGIGSRQIAYFSVDHPLYNGLSLEDLLELFKDVSKTDYSNIPTYIFFDEIQYLRDWEVHLKSLVDSYPHVKAIVSGSAAAALRLMSLESVAGRFTDFLLPPLTFHEYLTLLGKSNLIAHELSNEYSNIFIASDIVKLNNAFLNYLNYGGYPEVVFSPEIQGDPGRFIKADIIDKVLLRDLPSLYGIQDIQELNYLFTTLAFNTANEISLEELFKDSGVAKNTIKRYIEYLEAAFLIKTVHRVDQSGRRFKRANFFKVYLSNPSLPAYALDSSH